MHTEAETQHRKSARQKRERTRFDLRAPSAQSVALAGSFNDWNPAALAMKRSDDGIWSTEIALKPGRYEYKFIVDGAWCCNVTDGAPSEQADGCVPNDLGTMNRVIEVTD